MKKIIFLILLLLGSLSVQGGLSDGEHVVVSNFCLLKKDIPAGIRFSFKDNETFEFLSDDSAVTILKESVIKPKLPSTLKNNHFPVVVAVKGKFYYYLNNSWNISSAPLKNNPLSYGFEPRLKMSYSGSVSAMSNLPDLKEEDLNSPVIIPFHYYLGDKFVRNKLRVFIKKISNEGFKIISISSEAPLPNGLTVTGRNFKLPIKEDMYGAINFNYVSDTPLVFVKEYSQSLADFFLLQEYLFPVYINEKGVCFVSSIEKPELLSREGNEDVYKQYDSVVSDLSMVANNKDEIDKIKLSFTREMLYRNYPLGHILRGNGREATECSFTSDVFQSYFKNETENIQKAKTEADLKTIKIPKEKAAFIEIYHKGKKTKILLLKRYTLNDEWKPEGVGNAEFDCMPFCPKILNKKTNKYFKNSEIKIPQSLYSNSELICGMIGD